MFDRTRGLLWRQGGDVSWKMLQQICQYRFFLPFVETVHDGSRNMKEERKIHKLALWFHAHIFSLALPPSPSTGGR